MAFPRLLQRLVVPLVCFVALFLFWAYAAYQDISWVAVFVVSSVVTLVSFGSVVMMGAQAARLTIRQYLGRHRGRVVSALALLGVIVPVISLVSVAVTLQSVVGFDLSGVQFYVSGLAFFVFFECLALAAVIAIPRKLR